MRCGYRRRPELSAAGLFWDEPEIRDTDICITTRELAQWIQDENIDFANLEDGQFDKAFGEASGGGRIFGNSGGVFPEFRGGESFERAHVDADADDHLSPFTVHPWRGAPLCNHSAHG